MQHATVLHDGLIEEGVKEAN